MIEMKDSGFEWIGEIPKDWKLAQVRYLFKIGRGRVIAQTELKEEGVYPVFSSQTKNNGCLGYIDSYDFDVKQITWTTDGANAGTVFYREGKHNCTNVCGTLQPLYDNIDLKYQKYAIEHIAYYHKRADTNGFKIMNNEMAAIHTIIPPFEKQHRIADYLDSKCSKIDAIIEREQAVIEKLKEYKLSVITEAVTKGLNPDVEMKDSGVEWIGEIPSGCTVTRAGHLYNIILGKMLSPNQKKDTDTLEKYFCAANVHFSGTNSDGLKKMWFSEDEKNTYEVKKGDLLVVEGGAGAGGACIIEQDITNCYVQNSIMIVREKNGISNKWLFYTLYSLVNREYIDFVSNKATIPHFTKDKLSNAPIVLFSERKILEIINKLDTLCVNVDSTISRKQTVIDKLTEYKKSLIYEVVTGKKEV